LTTSHRRRVSASPFDSNKILGHLDKIIEWLDGKNPFAVTMEVDPTDKCNHHCPGCAGGRTSNDTMLGELEMMRVIKQATVLGLRGITFTGGGEPLLNPYTIESMDYAKRLGLDVGLITNGSIGYPDWPKLLKICSWIRISLDAGTPEMHRLTHGSKGFARVVQNIRNIVSTKDSDGCTMGLGYLTGKGTDGFRDMMDFVDLAIELGVDYAQFRPYHTQASKDLHRFRPIDWAPFERKSTPKTAVLTSKHKYDAMLNGEIERRYDTCYGHQFATTLCANGDLTICCHTRGLPWATLGNIRDKSLEEIWNSEQRQEAVERIDLSKCPLLCRCNTFNEILWQIKQPKTHPNFL